MTTPKQPERRSAETPFTDAGLALPTTLGEFWAWSSSDLLSNALRGQLAEFIVGTALGCLKSTAIRTEWDAYDLVTTSGVRIEVKSTAYLQSWGPTAPSSLRFSIAERYAWDARTNTSATERSRSADVYVFCVHTEISPQSADPLELRQWEFYVVPTAVLNAEFPGQKTIGLPVLRSRTGAPSVGFTELDAAVRTAAH